VLSQIAEKEEVALASEKIAMGATCPVPQPEERCQNRCRGKLDECGALAVPHGAVQSNNPEVYTQSEALAQGTLFPCLNLPFYLKVNGSPVPATPLSELQALHFVVNELGPYLDTHPDDTEAFELFQRYAEMAKKAKKAYEAKYGPLSQMAAAQGERYGWTRGPWPWEVRKVGE
jgi:spore coat protein JB